MPSTTSPVGAISIPLPADTAGDAIDDPIVVGLLDYIAWTLNDALTVRVANWPSYGSQYASAVPDANRFDWNPLEPTAHTAKLPVPALWLWWHGRDTHQQYTIVQRKRARQLRMLYVVPELPRLAELGRRAGLLSTAAAALHRANAWQRHPSYAYGTSADGTPLYQSLAEVGLLSFELLGCEQVRFGIDGGEPGTPQPTERKSGRDYPALAAVWAVEEVVGPKTMQDPDDLNRDHAVAIHGSDTDEAVELFDRVLGAPDGSERL